MSEFVTADHADENGFVIPNAAASVLTAINVVRADVCRHDDVAFNIKDCAQVCLDLRRVNGTESLWILCERKRASKGFSWKIFHARRVESFWLGGSA
jgi:hypothetical protein